MIHENEGNGTNGKLNILRIFFFTIFQIQFLEISFERTFYKPEINFFDWKFQVMKKSVHL